MNISWTFFLLSIFCFIFSVTVEGQIACGPPQLGKLPCPPYAPCCSQWGFCGNTTEYCDVLTYKCQHGCHKITNPGQVNVVIPQAMINPRAVFNPSTPNREQPVSNSHDPKFQPPIIHNPTIYHPKISNTISQDSEPQKFPLPKVAVGTPSPSIQSGFRVDNQLNKDFVSGYLRNYQPMPDIPLDEENDTKDIPNLQNKDYNYHRRVQSAVSEEDLDDVLSSSDSVHPALGSFDYDEAGPFNSPIKEPFMKSENPFFDSRGLYSSCAQKNTVALTYDDGPSEYTDGILDALKDANVKATFFVLGENIRTPQARHTIKRMFDEGHIIASHSYSHPNMTKLNYWEIRREMDLTSDIIKNITGFRPAYMRPPFGEVNESVKKAIFDLGYKIILWNVDTNDWKFHDKAPLKIYTGLQTELSRYEQLRFAKSWIPLQHDLYEATMKMQPIIFKMIKLLGYDIVPLNECLEDEFSPYFAGKEVAPVEYKNLPVRSRYLDRQSVLPTGYGRRF